MPDTICQRSYQVHRQARGLSTLLQFGHQLQQGGLKERIVQLVERHRSCLLGRLMECVSPI